MNGGLFGLAGMLPSAATSALMNGSSLSGLLVSLVCLVVVVVVVLVVLVLVVVVVVVNSKLIRGVLAVMMDGCGSILVVVVIVMLHSNISSGAMVLVV